jgi:hypothetical protein
MSILKGKVNPLNALELRITPTILPHFKTVNVPYRHDNIKTIDEINRWIYLNLSGRYCIDMHSSNNNNNDQTNYSFTIGFEDPRDLTVFLLSESNI